MQMHLQIVYMSWILCSDEGEQIIASYNCVDESHKQKTGQKEGRDKTQVLCNSI